MIEVSIPSAVAQVAVRHALSNSQYEVGGAFMMDNLGHGVGGSRIRYVPGTNISPSPVDSIELAAEWIYELLQGGQADLLGFFHSHPRGERQPSGHDMLAFPRHYVSQAWIFYGDVNRLTWYNDKTWKDAPIQGGLQADLWV
jgi:proteasome lid subunit RPN8/RPN11